MTEFHPLKAKTRKMLDKSMTGIENQENIGNP